MKIIHTVLLSFSLFMVSSGATNVSFRLNLTNTSYYSNQSDPIYCDTISKPSHVFPFLQLWNLTKRYTCSEKHVIELQIDKNSCSNSTMIEKRDRCCECNNHCMYYGTCCIDMYWNDTKTSLDDYLLFFYNKSKTMKTKTFVCEDPFPFLPSNIVRSYYLMVRSCIEGADDEDTRECAKDHKHLPAVYGSDKYIYKNYFCARCNFVESFKPVNFRLSQCGGPLNMNVGRTISDKMKWLKEINVQNCRIDIDNSTMLDVPLKTCEKKYWPTTCKQKGFTSELCNVYLGKYKNLLNYHCLLCGSKQPKDYSDCLVRNGTRLWRFPTVTLSMLFVLSNNPLSSNKETHAHNLCENGELPNFVENKCVPFACPPFYQVVNSSCVNILSSLTSLNSSRVLKCLLKRNPFIFTAFHQSNNYTYIIQKLRSFADIPLDGIENFTVHGDQQIIKIKRKFVDRLLTKIQNRSPKTDKLLAMLDWLVIMPYEPIITHQVEYHKTFPGKRLCAKPKVINTTSNELRNSCYVMQGNMQIKSSQLSMSVKITRNEVSQHFTTCERFYLQKSSCELDTLTEGFRYSSDGKLIDYRKQGENYIYDIEDYIPLKEGVGICTDSRIDIIKMLRESRGTISFIGHSVSCICHALVLLTFGILDDEFPGYGLVSLCVSLFLSDVLLLMIISFHTFQINVMPKFCEMIAMCLHFSLLSVQACAVVSSVDLYKQLGQVIIVRRSHHTAKEFFRHRAVLMFFFPLLIVIGAMLLDLNGIIVTGYGAHGICLFSGLTGKIIFFIVPSVITFLTSIVFISYTVYKVSKICRDNKKTLHGSGRRHLSIPLIALKLVLTYGISEGLGFIRIPGDSLSIQSQTFNISFDFLYTILRSFRGCIIFIIYICRQTVLIKYKEIIFRARQTVVIEDSVRNISQSQPCTREKEIDSMNENDLIATQRQDSGNVEKESRFDNGSSLLEIDATVHNTLKSHGNGNLHHARSKSDGTREVTNAFETHLNYSSEGTFQARKKGSENQGNNLSSPSSFHITNNVSCNNSSGFHGSNTDKKSSINNVKLEFEGSINGFFNHSFRDSDKNIDLNATKRSSENVMDYIELVTSVKLKSSVVKKERRKKNSAPDKFTLYIKPPTPDKD